MDLKTELAKIAEAYCVENKLPVNRKYTDAELAATFDNLRASKPIAEAVEATARAAGLTP